MLTQFIGRITTSLVLAGVAIGAGTAIAAAQSFTDWGLPQPYEKVSDKSVAWLKEKGWWPLGVGWQGPFSGQNTINVVMDKAGLLAKRGLEAKYQVFAAGPDVNEAVASARVQVGNGGNFPFTSLLDRGVPHEFALYLLPNAKAIRLVESGSLLHLLHKWTMRTCFNAQEEIYQSSIEEVEQVRAVFPELARYIGPPCHLRAGISTPICTEGSHFCGVKVWLDFPNIQRRI